MKTYFDGWKRMFSFKGESTRAQFWVFHILNFFLIYVLYMLLFAAVISELTSEGEGTEVVDAISKLNLSSGVSLFMSVFAFLYLIASWTIAVRRLHDSGKSGWCLLLGLIPMIGWIILLVFYLLPSKGY